MIDRFAGMECAAQFGRRSLASVPAIIKSNKNDVCEGDNVLTN